MRSVIPLVLISIFALTPSNSKADSATSAPRIELRDEGAVQGPIQRLDCTGAGVTCSRAGVTGTVNVTGGGSGYATIQDEATPLTQRTAVNFIGSGIACVDNAGSARTDCTVSGSGGSGLTHPEVMSRIALGF